MQPRFDAAFAIVLDRASRVLLCHRTDRDAWNLPGGGRAPGESPRKTLLREVAEETGLRVALARHVGRYRVPSQGVVVETWQCTVVGGNLRCSDEADRVGWFFHTALPATTLPRHVERVADALAGDPRVLRRTQ
ncbi:NUDIX domain-containing protein [Salinisphaera sp.]|uniref:NUDIX hydrolase n=1 Tax=Salinisphaera sp. TaxID=1914330 RepID=UPI000C4DBCC6|nr:NUDIX hydrolase [Salinisphaera sp.]